MPNETAGTRPLLDRLVEVGPREPGRPSFQDVAQVLLLASVLLVGAATPARDDAGRANAPLMATIERATSGGLCLFRRFTGIPCAGCGLTRGVVQTMHGELGEAVRLHPLAPLVVLWVASQLAEATSVAVLRRRVTNRIPWPIAWKLYGASLAAFLGLGAWRLVTGLAALFG